MKTKKFLARFGLVFVMVLALSLASGGLSRASEDGADVHIKVEASKDGGATWHNYSGTESSGGETINANPGDTIQIRVNTWNSALDYWAIGLTGTGTVTNTSYIASGGVTNTDLDTDGIAYTGSFFGGSGIAGVTPLTDHGTETYHNETMLASITLSNDFPVGETVITATGTLGDFTSESIRELTMFDKFLGVAHAQQLGNGTGTGRESAVKIAVDVAAPTATATATASPTPTPTATVLPQTGTSNHGSNSSGIAAGIASLIALGLIYGLFRTLKKSA